MSKYLRKQVSTFLIATCVLGALNVNGKIVLANEPSADTSTSTNASGYTFDNVTINGGGYVPAVIFNKSERDLAYLRTDMGGAYRWDPKNNKWIPLTDWVSAKDWNLLGCESIATDPIDTDRVYIVAGMYTNDWTDQNAYLLRSRIKGIILKKLNCLLKQVVICLGVIWGNV